MPKTHLLLLGLLLTALATAGCRSIDVATYSEPYFNPKQVKTYAWMPNGSAAFGVQSNRLTFVETTIKNAVDTNLTGRGWQPVEPAKADVLLRFVMGAENSYEVKRSGTSNIAGQTVEVPLEYKKLRSGRLAIDIIDNQQQLIVWRGVAGKTVEGDPDQNKVKTSLENAVNMVLKKL